MKEERRDPMRPTRRTMLRRPGGRRITDPPPIVSAGETLLRVSVAAKRLGVHPKTVRIYYRSGKLPFRRSATGRILIPEAAIAEFLNTPS